MVFIDDANAVGKWEYCGAGAFSPKEIYFLPGGQKYWIFEGWTKGLLFTHEGGDAPVVANPYAIEGSFMRLEMDGGTRLYRKTSDKEYALGEIGRHDPIDRPFVLDEAVLGTWCTVDCCISRVRDFKPGKPRVSRLWLESVRFDPDGSAVRVYDGQEWRESWTKGFHINRRLATASAYRLKKICGRVYLFLEWKMGNYVYGGAKPDYYVFEKGEA